MKNGMPLEQVATGFINSDEFKSMYGANPSTDQFITLLYKNVLHRSPDESGFASWMTALNSQGWGREQVLIGFSESPENKRNTQSATSTIGGDCSSGVGTTTSPTSTSTPSAPTTAGTPTSQPPAVPAPVAFNPASVTLDCDMGISCKFVVRANVIDSSAFNNASAVYAYVVDATGVLDNENASIARGSSLSFVGTFHILPTLSSGRHQGNFELRLCRDVGCTSQFSGSPIQLPYDIQIISPVGTLSPLTKWSAAGDWAGWQGSATHTGYVPVILDPSKFSFRWRWYNKNGGNIRSVVTSNALVYIATDISNLWALKEHDASQQWVFGAPISEIGWGGLAISKGNVIATSGNGNNAFLWGLRGDNGTQIFKTPFVSTTWWTSQPIADNGAVFLTAGVSYTQKTISSFDASNGKLNWSAPNLGTQASLDFNPDALAADANYVYGFGNGGLMMFSRSTGGLVTNISPKNSFGDYISDSVAGTSPVVSTTQSVISASTDRTWSSFDVANRIAKWSIGTQYPTQYTNVVPALAKGVLYVVSSSMPMQLEARRETDGTLLWAWSAPNAGERGFGNIVVTDNIVFVSSDKHVYAIDLNTHAAVWSYFRGGRLALSANGVLYISTILNGTTDNHLSAVNLK